MKFLLTLIDGEELRFLFLDYVPPIHFLYQNRKKNLKVAREEIVSQPLCKGSHPLNQDFPTLALLTFGAREFSIVGGRLV